MPTPLARRTDIYSCFSSAVGRLNLPLSASLQPVENRARDARRDSSDSSGGNQATTVCLPGARCQRCVPFASHACVYCLVLHVSKGASCLFCFVLFCFVLFCFVLSALVDVDATIASKWWWYVFGRASGCMGVWVVLCVLVSAAFVF